VDYNPLELKNKTVIITGGTSGIGFALAARFLKEGFYVVITGRDEQRLDRAVKKLSETSDNIFGIAADAASFEDCKKAVEFAIEKCGRIDVLVNNAGMSMRGLFADTDLDVLHKLMNINFWGTVYFTKLTLPYLLQTKGSVVGISSIAGKKGLPGRTGYSASKFAMEGFLETIRTENLKKGLHVLVACPGFTASGIRNASLGPDGKSQKESPLDESKLMTADQVAGHIFNAVSRRKRDLILTVNGKLTVWLDKFFPKTIDKLVYNHMAKEPGSPFK